MSNYSSRIKEIIKNKELSVSDFCKMIGLNSPTTIHLLIKENRKPSSKTVKRIIETFPEYSEEWLLYGIEAKKGDEDDLTVTAQQVIKYFEKKQTEVENKFYENGLEALHLLNNKIDEEALIVKDGKQELESSINLLHERLLEMERYMFLMEKETKQFVNKIDNIKCSNIKEEKQ